MYHIIKNDLNDKVVGKDYPQVNCLTMNQAHLLQSWLFLDPEPELKLELKKKAILTDVLSDATINASGFLINEKLKNILESFKLIRHKFYLASVKAKAENFDFYWLHLSEPEITKSLDYQNSTFFRTEYTFREEPIELHSLEDYNKIKSQDNDASFGVELDKIVVSNSFDKELDMFTFLPFDSNIYISEKLKHALLKNNITGFRIEEATNLIIS
jgi:hypothetical protein